MGNHGGQMSERCRAGAQASGRIGQEIDMSDLIDIVRDL